MSIQTAYQGNLLDCSGTFKNASGTATDPTTVTFVWKCGSSTGTYTYSGSSTPTTGTVWKTGTGAYTARIDTTGLSGTLSMSFEGTGALQAVGVLVATILVNPA